MLEAVTELDYHAWKYRSGQEPKWHPRALPIEEELRLYKRIEEALKTPELRALYSPARIRALVFEYHGIRCPHPSESRVLRDAGWHCLDCDHRHDYQA
jgi:hypothetical protein